MRHNVLFKTIVLFVFALFLAATPVHAKKKKGPDKGYRFTLFIHGTQDSVMYMGNYYAGSTYAIDTAHRNSKGLFVFEDKERKLLPGLYFFSNPQGTYVEFAVHGDEKLDFQFETEDPGWQTHMRVRGSKENEIMFKYHQANRIAYRIIDSAQAALPHTMSAADSAAFKEFRHKQLQRLDSIKEDFIAKYPNSMLSLLMNATREVMVPKRDSLGNELPMRDRWEYYMDHYWDYCRLDDDAMVRTPEMIFHKRLTEYLDMNLKNAPAETIIEYVDKLIARAKPAHENFKYLVHTIATKYLQSNVMSYDAIYVHMVKEYIGAGLCDWMPPSAIDENVKRANIWDNLLIGKVAPELIMKDANGQIHSLHQMGGKYKLLVFWSPTCGHCKTIIPDLYRVYTQYRDKYDITAFAILSEPDDATRPKWHEFIKDKGLNWLNIDGGEANIDWHEVYDIITTPQIYLLDKDNKILAKKLNAETFEQVLKALEGF